MAALIILAAIATFVVPIIWFANRAARAGRRFSGTEDPIAEYDRRAQNRQAGRWWQP